MSKCRKQFTCHVPRNAHPKCNEMPFCCGPSDLMMILSNTCFHGFHAAITNIQNKKTNNLELLAFSFLYQLLSSIPSFCSTVKLTSFLFSLSTSFGQLCALLSYLLTLIYATFVLPLVPFKAHLIYTLLIIINFRKL